MRIAVRCAVVVAAMTMLLAVSSCSSNAEIVRSSLINGTWTYGASNGSGSYTFDIDFHPDGTFLRTVSGTGQVAPGDAQSEWRVDGTRLTLCFAGCSVAGISAEISPNGNFSAEGVDTSGQPFTWSLTEQSAFDPLETTSEQSPSTAVPAPAGPDSDSAFRGTVDVRNADGYTWRIDYGLGRISEPQVSILDDKPGQASATAEVRGRLAVSNTTAGRNAPGLDDLQIRGLYRSDRAACTLLTDPNSIVFDRTGNDVETLPSGEYCSTRLAESSMTDSTMVTLQFSHRDEAFLQDGLSDLVRGPDIYVLQFHDSIPTTLRSSETCEMRDPEASPYGINIWPVVLAAQPEPAPDCTPL